MFDLNLLEFPKILNKISVYATLNETREAILNIEPLNDKDTIDEVLSETEETLNLLYRLQDPELYPFDLSFSIDRIRLGSFLNVREFLEILKLALNVSKLTQYFKKGESLGAPLDHIKKSFNNLVSLKDVKDIINQVLDVDGNILDNASLELSKIRRNIHIYESEITQKLNQILKEKSQILSESIITIRNGHRVIPVNSNYKSLIKGIIYDESQSGQTVYIEPYSCIELENKINLLKTDEEKEIEKILYDLSNKIFEYSFDIINDYNIVLYFDLLFAKSKYAKEIDAIKPIISNDINLIDARHPLIDPEKIVPNTISFKELKTMIITGPNTGGKTVVLKTLGLLSLMAQSGILIPVKDGSCIKVFDSIYADIGDEQSIEQNLSTFSSHMRRIVNITENVSENSLILLDELGSGTDPKEGASLAISILNYLRRRNVYIITTTHYPELKLYAYNDEDILNASVEFDVDSLKPTYKLLIGISGRSNAFLISKRLGLNNEIIKEAKSLNFDLKTKESSLVNKLERQSIENQKIKDELMLKEKELETLIQEEKDKNKLQEIEYSKKIDEINTKRNELLEKAQREVIKLLDEIKELKKKIESNITVKDNELIDLRGKTNSLYKDKLIKAVDQNHEIKVGDTVKVIEYDSIAKVESIKGDKYKILMGSISMNVKRKEIEYAETKDYTKLEKKNTESNLKLDTSSTLDLRGKRYEEAVILLEKFIDDAIYSNLETVEVIHGFGSLTLRNMVIKYAKTHDVIKSFRAGNEHEGGNGITIMNLK